MFRYFNRILKLKKINGENKSKKEKESKSKNFEMVKIKVYLKIYTSIVKLK